MPRVDGDIVLGVTLDPSNAISEAEELRGKIQSTLNQLNGQKLSREMAKLTSQTENATTRVSSLSAKLEELLSLDSSGTTPALEKLKESAADAQKELELANKTMEELVNKRIDSVKNFPWAKNKGEEGLRDWARNDLLTGSTDASDKFGKIRSTYHGVAEAAEEARQKIAQVNEEYNSTKPEVMANLRSEIENTTMKVNAATMQMTKSIQDLQQQAKAEGIKLNVDGVGDAEEGVNKVSQRFKWLESTMNSAKKVLSSFISTLKRLAKSTVKSGLGALRNQIKGLGSDSGDASKSVKRLLRTFIKYGFGVRSFFFLWRKLRTAIKEGFEELAASQGETGGVAQAIMSLASSLRYLRNSWVAAFSPILQYVAPILSYLMDVLSNIATAIGSFFAVLTGKPMVRAIKQQLSLSDALGDTADNAKDTSKNTKKAKHDLAEFDDLDVLKQPEDDSSGLGGGGAGGGGAGTDALGNAMFEEVSAANEWAERIKAAWKKEDWYGVGEVIGDAINQMVDALNNWITKTFRPWAEKWAERLAIILNGAVKTIKWDKIGELLANSMNSVMSAAVKFLSTFDFKELGKGLGEIITSWFNGIEWETITDFFADLVNAKIDLFYGVITTVFGGNNAITFGQKIADAIKLWFSKVKWEELATTLKTGLNGAITTFATFIQDEEMWKEVKENLQIIWDTLGNVDVGKLAETLSDAFTNTLDTIDWEVVGNTIGEFFGNIKWTDVITSILTNAWSFIKGAWNGFWEGEHGSELASGLLAILAGELALETLTFSLKETVIKSAGKAMSNSSLLSLLAEALGLSTTALGIVAGAVVLTIGLTFATGGKYAPEIDVDQLDKETGKISKEFSTNVPTVTEAFGGGDAGSKMLGTKLANWLVDLFGGKPKKDGVSVNVELDGSTTKQFDNNVKTWNNFSKNDEKTANVEMTGTSSGSFNYLVEKRAEFELEPIQKLRTDLSGKVETTFTSLKEKWDSLKDKGKDLLATLKGKVQSTYTNLQEKWDNLKEKGKDLKATADGIIHDSFTTLKEKWDNLKSKTETLTGKAKNALGQTFKDMKTTWDNFKSKTATLTGKVINSMGNAYNVVKSAWDSLYSKTVTLTAAFTDTFSGPLKSAWNAVADKINGGIDVINKALPSGLKIGRIPRLAQGAVIPANSEFLAVLGDQKQGTNIEAPLDTMVDAFRMAASDIVTSMSGNSSNYAEMTLDGQTFARLIVPYVMSELNRKGYKTTVLER